MVVSNKSSSLLMRRRSTIQRRKKSQRSNSSNNRSSKKFLKCGNSTHRNCKHSKLSSVHKGGGNESIPRLQFTLKSNTMNTTQVLDTLTSYTVKINNFNDDVKSNYDKYIQALQLFFNHNTKLYSRISKEIFIMIDTIIIDSFNIIYNPANKILDSNIKTLLTNALHYNAVVFRGEYLQQIYNDGTYNVPRVFTDLTLTLTPKSAGSNVLNDTDTAPVNLVTIKWLITDLLYLLKNKISSDDIFILGNFANVFHDLGKFITGVGPAPDHPRKGFEELKKICLEYISEPSKVTVKIPFIYLYLVNVNDNDKNIPTNILKNILIKILPETVNAQEWLTKAIILLQISHDVIAAACTGEASERFIELTFKDAFDKQILKDVIENEDCANVFWCMTTLNIMADVGTNSPRIQEHYRTGYKTYFDALKRLCKNADNKVVPTELSDTEKLQNRITLLLNANLAYDTANKMASDLIVKLDTLGKTTEFMIGVMDKYFIKGDFMRVIFQEAFVSDTKDELVTQNTSAPQNQDSRIVGLLKFFEILNSVWQHVLPAIFIKTPTPTPTTLPYKIDGLPERVLIGNNIRVQETVGNNNDIRKNVRDFWHKFSTISEKDSVNVKAYLLHQAKNYYNTQSSTTTLAYDGSNDLKDLTDNNITYGAEYMKKLIHVPVLPVV